MEHYNLASSFANTMSAHPALAKVGVVLLSINKKNPYQNSRFAPELCAAFREVALTLVSVVQLSVIQLSVQSSLIQIITVITLVRTHIFQSSIFSYLYRTKNAGQDHTNQSVAEVIAGLKTYHSLCLENLISPHVARIPYT